MAALMYMADSPAEALEIANKVAADLGYSVEVLPGLQCKRLLYTMTEYRTVYVLRDTWGTEGVATLTETGEIHV